MAQSVVTEVNWFEGYRDSEAFLSSSHTMDRETFHMFKMFGIFNQKTKINRIYIYLFNTRIHTH